MQFSGGFNLGDSLSGTRDSAMAYTIRQLADLLGVSKSQVARDKALGMPMDDADAARAWRRQQHDLSRTADGRIDRPATASTPSRAGAGPGEGLPGPAAVAEDDAPDDDTDTAQFRAARARRERVNADRAELELEELRGRLVELKEAQRLVFTAFRSLRDQVLNVAPRVKDQLASMTDAAAIERLLEDELGAVLGGFNPSQALTDTEDDAPD
jgi:hypothetical protein